MRKFIGTKHFYRRLLTVTMPLLIQQIITSTVQLVDNVMVGRLGESAIGAVSVVNQLYFVVILFSFGIMSGASIYSAQYFGSKDFDKLKQSFRFKLIAAFVVSMLSFVILSVGGQWFLERFTTNPTTLALGLDYLNIVKWTSFYWLIAQAISSTFKDTGVTKPFLYVAMAALFTNTILNYLLIFGIGPFPELGVKGAAYATTVSRMVELLFSMIVLLRSGSLFSTKIKDIFKIDPHVFKLILVMATPLLVNEVLWSMGLTMYLHAYSVRGDQALAAINITNAVSQLLFVAFNAMGAGAAVMVGNTLGENKLEEAKDNAFKLISFSVLFSFAAGLILMVLAPSILTLYDILPETKDISLVLIRLNSVMIIFFAYNVALYFIMRAGGDMRSTLFMDAGFMWFIAIPVALGLAYFTELNIIWMFLIIQGLDIPKAIFASYRFKKDIWVKNLAVK